MSNLDDILKEKNNELLSLNEECILLKQKLTESVDLANHLKDEINLKGNELNDLKKLINNKDFKLDHLKTNTLEDSLNVNLYNQQIIETSSSDPKIKSSDIEEVNNQMQQDLDILEPADMESLIKENDLLKSNLIFSQSDFNKIKGRYNRMLKRLSETNQLLRSSQEQCIILENQLKELGSNEVNSKIFMDMDLIVNLTKQGEENVLSYNEVDKNMQETEIFEHKNLVEKRKADIFEREILISKTNSENEIMNKEIMHLKNLNPNIETELPNKERNVMVIKSPIDSKIEELNILLENKNQQLMEFTNIINIEKADNECQSVLTSEEIDENIQIMTQLTDENCKIIESTISLKSQIEKLLEEKMNISKKNIELIENIGNLKKINDEQTMQLEFLESNKLKHTQTLNELEIIKLENLNLQDNISKMTSDLKSMNEKYLNEQDKNVLMNATHSNEINKFLNELEDLKINCNNLQETVESKNSLFEDLKIAFDLKQLQFNKLQEVNEDNIKSLESEKLQYLTLQKEMSEFRSKNPDYQQELDSKNLLIQELKDEIYKNKVKFDQFFFDLKQNMMVILNNKILIINSILNIQENDEYVNNLSQDDLNFDNMNKLYSLFNSLAIKIDKIYEKSQNDIICNKNINEQIEILIKNDKDNLLTIENLTKERDKLTVDLNENLLEKNSLMNKSENYLNKLNKLKDKFKFTEDSHKKKLQDLTDEYKNVNELLIQEKEESIKLSTKFVNYNEEISKIKENFESYQNKFYDIYNNILKMNISNLIINKQDILNKFDAVDIGKLIDLIDSALYLQNSHCNSITQELELSKMENLQLTESNLKIKNILDNKQSEILTLESKVDTSLIEIEKLKFDLAGLNIENINLKSNIELLNNVQVQKTFSLQNMELTQLVQNNSSIENVVNDQYAIEYKRLESECQDLKSKVNDLEGTKSKMLSKLKQLKDKLDITMKLNHDLENIVGKNIDEVRLKNDEISKLNSELENSFLSYEKKIKEKIDENNSIQIKYSKSKTEINNLNEIILEKETVCKNFEVLIHGKNIEIEELNEKILKLKSNTELKVSEFGQIQSANFKLNVDIEQLNLKHNLLVEENNLDKDRLLQLNAEINKMNTDKNNFISQIDILNHELEINKGDYIKLKNKFDENILELYKLENSIKIQIEIIEKLNNDISIKIEENMEIKLKNENLEANLQLATLELSDYKFQLEDIVKKYSICSEKISQLEFDRNKGNDQFSNIEREKFDLEKKINQIQIEYNILLDEKNVANSLLQEQLNSLYKEFQFKEKNIIQITKEMEYLESDKQKLISDCEYLNNLINDFKNEIQDLVLKNTELYNEITILKDEASKKNIRIKNEELPNYLIEEIILNKEFTDISQPLPDSPNNDYKLTGVTSINDLEKSGHVEKCLRHEIEKLMKENENLKSSFNELTKKMSLISSFEKVNKETENYRELISSSPTSVLSSEPESFELFGPFNHSNFVHSKIHSNRPLTPELVELSRYLDEEKNKNKKLKQVIVQMQQEQINNDSSGKNEDATEQGFNLNMYNKSLDEDEFITGKNRRFTYFQHPNIPIQIPKFLKQLQKQYINNRVMNLQRTFNSIGISPRLIFFIYLLLLHIYVLFGCLLS